MTAPDEFRIRAEAAFPRSVFEPGPARDIWCVTFAAPLNLDGVEVSGISLSSDGLVVSCRLVMTAEVVGTAKHRWLIARDAVFRRMQSVTAHQIVEARRRLGL